MSLQVTDHALERYATRIKGDDLSDFRLFSQDKKDRYKEELNAMFEHSKTILVSTFNADKDIRRFNLADDMILMLEEHNDTLITMYRIDFGFDNETNRILKNRLLAQLENEEASLDEKTEKMKLEAEDTKEQLEMLQAERDELQAALNAVNDSINVTFDYLADLKRRIKESKYEYKKIAKQLIYSINCKMSLKSREDLDI